MFHFYFSKNICLNENRKILEVLLKEKKSLENKHEELEIEKTNDLKEKLASAKRKYTEMKHHLVSDSIWSTNSLNM